MDSEKGKAPDKWILLAVVCGALFIIMMQNTTINLANPDIMRDFGVGMTTVEWVLTSYMLAFSSFLSTMGKVGDAIGRKKTFAIGIALYALGGNLAGLSGSIAALIASAVVQGLGGSAMMPATQSLIAANFEKGERGKAMGAWGAVSGLAVVAGPLIGGALAQDGFDASMINFGRFEKGEFAVDFWIHRRSTGEKIFVGRVAFTATDAPAAPAAAATPIALSDRGAGLVIQDAEYATRLKIFDRGSGRWSLGSLLSSGALNGSTDGKPHFCAWLVGPPTSTYQDESGRPKYLYRYRVAYPDGKSWESSPSYFYEPGYASVALSLTVSGIYKVEFSIASRDGKQSWPAGTTEFVVVD